MTHAKGDPAYDKDMTEDGNKNRRFNPWAYVAAVTVCFSLLPALGVIRAVIAGLAAMFVVKVLQVVIQKRRREPKIER